MKIFDFVKNAGEKIFKPGEARRETAIEKHLEKYGIRGISVEVDGDKAILTGAATDTATREKAVLIAGNVEGIGNVEDRLTVTNPTPAPVAASPTSTASVTATTTATGGGQWISRTYTVKSGDTLSKISKEMYGEASKYPQIFEANKPMLSDPDKIYPGQVLRVPPEQ
ncbi:MAG: LysM and BON domain-containing protein [Lysobacter sp.]